MRTSLVWAKSTSGLRSISVRIGSAASSSARTLFSDPLTARPIGVRIASTMTASGIGSPGSGFERSEPEAAHALFAPSEVVGELVANGPRYLGLEQLRVVAEVPGQGVTEDH